MRFFQVGIIFSESQMIVIRIKIQIRKIGFDLMNDFGVQLVLKQKRAE